MLFFISSDIHPNPGPIDPIDYAMSTPVGLSGETDLYNVPTVLSGCTSLALVSLLLTFKKFFRDTLGPVQCAHLLSPLPKLSSNLYLSVSAKLKNPHCQK